MSSCFFLFCCFGAFRAAALFPPFSALDSPDAQQHADEAVCGNGQPYACHAQCQWVDRQPYQADPQSPHTDDAHQKGETHIAGAAADAACDDGKAEEDFRGCRNKQRFAAQGNLLSLLFLW